MPLVVDVEAVIDGLALDVGNEAGDINDRHRRPLRAGSAVRTPRHYRQPPCTNRRGQCVAFDVGETLIDETRIWSRWADRLGVTRLRCSGCSEAWQHSIVRTSMHSGSCALTSTSRGSWRGGGSTIPTGYAADFDEADLYDDVRSCLSALHRSGRESSSPGTSRRRRGLRWRRWSSDVDAILISDELGAQKPSAAFFAAVVEAAGVVPRGIAYVGDRLDNDVLPARAGPECARSCCDVARGGTCMPSGRMRRWPTSSWTRCWTCRSCSTASVPPDAPQTQERCLSSSTARAMRSTMCSRHRSRVDEFDRGIGHRVAHHSEGTIARPHGRIAQLGQSACLTSKKSGVQVPLRPRDTTKAQVRDTTRRRWRMLPTATEKAPMSLHLTKSTGTT